ncbi:MAG: extracellular solute-binding protein [Clostridiaceae bacterium]|nr:extracellular solute-binding protein [Clostridiaceae bacterium]
MKRKVIAILLIAVLLMLGLAGCQSGTSTPTDPPAGKTDPPAGKTDPPAGKTDPPADNPFEGVHLKAICYECDSAYNEKVSQEISDRLGLTLEWVACPGDEGWAALDRLLAADPTIDIMYIDGRTRFESYISKGYLYDLTPFLDQTDKYPNLAKSAFHFAKQYATAEGRYYSLPLVWPGGYGGTNGYTWAFREDLLKQCNLDMPSTVDELEEILAAFKALDPSKYPLFTSSVAGGFGTLGILLSGAFTDNGMAWWVDDSGTLRHPVQDPNMKNFVAKLHDWYEKGYLHPEFVTATSGASTQLMSAGEVSVVAAWCTNAINPNRALMENNPEQRFAYMPGTVSGDKPAKLLAQTFAGAYVGINANTNIDAVMYTLNKLCDLDMRYLGEYGIEGTNWNIVDRKIVRESGDLAYNSECNVYGLLQGPYAYFFSKHDDRVDASPAGDHYIDTQYANYFKTFYVDERMEQIFFETDDGLVYDYSTGENQYPNLATVATTYLQEMVIGMIVGDMSLDDWDAKIAELETIALNQMVKERNEQWAKFDKKVYEWDGTQVVYEKDIEDWMIDYVW